VAVAPNGREGLEIQRAAGRARHHDIFMPEQEGLETIQELRRQSPRPRIIAMSGGGQLGTLEYLPAARSSPPTDDRQAVRLRGDVTRSGRC